MNHPKMSYTYIGIDSQVNVSYYFSFRTLLKSRHSHILSYINDTLRCTITHWF